MSVRRQRATTSKTYAMDKCYSVAVREAKCIHRYDGKFYMTRIGDCFTSLTEADCEIYGYDKSKLETWIFQDGKWRRIIDGKII